METKDLGSSTAAKIASANTFFTFSNVLAQLSTYLTVNIASASTFLTFSNVLAEHSTYLTAPIFFCSRSPCL